MPGKDGETTNRFLDWVEAEHGREIRDACEQCLLRDPDADLFAILDRVRARLLPGQSRHFSKMRYDF